MKTISMVELIGVATKIGKNKAAEVRKIKNKDPYSPATDYYKMIREFLIKTHKNGHEKSALDEFNLSQVSEAKRTHFRSILNGHRKWCGRKKIQWFDPPRASYCYSQVEVAVKPELGLIFDEKRYVIKLILTQERLDKHRKEMFGTLMELALRDKISSEDIFAILEVRGPRLILVDGETQDMKNVLNCELNLINQIWEEV